MIASFTELYHGPAIVASLPPVFAAKGDDRFGRLIVVTVSPTVPFQSTFFADSCLTFLACAFLSTCCAINRDVFGLDPLATVLDRAV